MPWSYVWGSGYYSVDVTNNAQLVYDNLINQGVTLEATCAIIGNWQYESGLNPGQWQHGYSVGDWGSAGLGMGQWTPASKLADYIGSYAETDVADGDNQLAYFLATPSQWSTYYLNPDGSSSYYGLSGLPYIDNLNDFLHSTEDTQTLATLFMVCWERCNKNYQHLDTRKSYAQYWYDYFGGTSTAHTIRISTTGSGTASASAYRADSGTTILLSAVPSSGETFYGWTVTSGNITIDDPTATSTFFVMGTENVNIRARFSGTAPPDPPSPPAPTQTTAKRKHMPIWMYPMFR